MLLVALAMFGVFFFVSLYMQNILGYSASQAGAAFLPMTLLIILIAPLAGKTSDRVGSRWLMTAGHDAALRSSSSTSRGWASTRASGPAAGAAGRRRRDGARDDADRRRRDARRAGGQGGRRLGGAEHASARSAARSGIALIGAIMAHEVVDGAHGRPRRSSTASRPRSSSRADRARGRRRRGRARPARAPRPRRSRRGRSASTPRDSSRLPRKGKAPAAAPGGSSVCGLTRLRRSIRRPGSAAQPRHRSRLASGAPPAPDLASGRAARLGPL